MWNPDMNNLMSLEMQVRRGTGPPAASSQHWWCAPSPTHTQSYTQGESVSEADGPLRYALFVEVWDDDTTSGSDLVGVGRIELKSTIMAGIQAKKDHRGE